MRQKRLKPGLGEGAGPPSTAQSGPYRSISLSMISKLYSPTLHTHTGHPHRATSSTAFSLSPGGRPRPQALGRRPPSLAPRSYGLTGSLSLLSQSPRAAPHPPAPREEPAGRRRPHLHLQSRVPLPASDPAGVLMSAGQPRVRERFPLRWPFTRGMKCDSSFSCLSDCSCA